jgi:hypothetical protein
LVQTTKKKSSKGELMIWRIKMQARVQLKDSICFNWVQIGSYKTLDPIWRLKEVQTPHPLFFVLVALGSLNDELQHCFTQHLDYL